MNAWVGPDSFQSGEWAQSVGTRGGLDGMNNVVETTNGVLIGAGFQASNDGKVHRYWASYDLQTGTKRWEAQVPSPQNNKISAFESLSPTRDGGVIVTGVLNAAPGSFEGFKSYGNPVDGQAFVAYYSAEQISGTSAPGAPTWETLIPNGMSGKSVRELPGDGAGFIAGVAGMEGEAPYLVRLRPALSSGNKRTITMASSPMLRCSAKTGRFRALSLSDIPVVQLVASTVVSPRSRRQERSYGSLWWVIQWAGRGLLRGLVPAIPSSSSTNAGVSRGPLMAARLSAVAPVSKGVTNMHRIVPLVPSVEMTHAPCGVAWW